MRTSPVNQSDGPLTDGCEPMRLNYIIVFLLGDEILVWAGRPSARRLFRRVASGQSISPDVPDTDHLPPEPLPKRPRSHADRPVSVQSQQIRCSPPGATAWSYPESERSKASAKGARRARSAQT